jgi:hypothetical protein
MSKIKIAMIVIIALVSIITLSSCFAVETTVEMKADAAYGVMHTQERVIDLPQDGGNWYLSVYGDPDDPRYIQLKQWLYTNSVLVDFRKQTHYNGISSKHPRYQRYAKTMPGLPCIRLQNSKGVVVSEFWDDNIPMTSEALVQGIKGDMQDKASWGCLRKRRNPSPCPTPDTNPTPKPQPVPTPIDTPPKFEPDPEPDKEVGPAPEPKPGFPWGLALLSAVIGGIVGVVQGYQKEHLSSPASVAPKP